MQRDFSQSALEQLLALVDQVESEKWSNVTDWIGDRFLGLEEWLGKLDVKKYANNLNSYHKKVIDKNNTSRQEITEIFDNVAAVDSTYAGKYGSLGEAMTALTSYAETLGGKIGANGIHVNGLDYLYIQISWGAYKEKITNAHVRKVYDEDGFEQYGGNQGAPSKASQTEKDKMYEIFKKNNPDVDLTEEQKTKLLERLNSEGCGYVAICNTIFEHYYLREDEFERDFGYPMYDENGKLNYNLLLMDLYSRMDNKEKTLWWESEDKYNDYDPEKDVSKDQYSVWDDDTGRGTTTYDREYYTEQFLKEHGVDAEFTSNVDVTPENYQDYVNDGKQVLISFHWGYMYDENNNKVEIPGGHSMTVTGVTDDGRLIVSSWGKKYYIDPNEKVEITDKDGNKHQTSISYETIKYK